MGVAEALIDWVVGNVLKNLVAYLQMCLVQIVCKHT